MASKTMYEYIYVCAHKHIHRYVHIKALFTAPQKIHDHLL